MNHMKQFFRLSLLLMVLLACSACSTLRVTDDPTLQNSSDPLSGLNRSIYALNTSADKVILRPIAVIYDTVLPDTAKQCVGRFFSNLNEPLNVVNNLLQGKVDGALNSTYRFAVNSTVGVLGLFDVAKLYHVKRRREDFGQTLAAWGVRPGPYIMVPFFGPSNVRDGLGLIAHSTAYFPVNQITENRITRAAMTSLNIVDARTDLFSTDDILNNQLDPYLFLKEAYDQSRLNAVFDGNPPEQSYDEFDF